MANIQIHELTTLGRTPATTDVLAIDTGTTTMKVGYGTVKDAIIAASNAGVVASEYSTSNTYAVGDFCIHNSVLYRCTTAITTGESWTSGHWTATTVGDEIVDVRDDIAALVSVSSNTLVINI